MKLQNLFKSKVQQCVLEEPTGELAQGNNTRMYTGTKQDLGQQKLNKCSKSKRNKICS